MPTIVRGQEVWTQAELAQHRYPLRSFKKSQPPAASAQESETVSSEAEMLDQLKRLAKKHGWENRYTYNQDGDDRGLHVILARAGDGVIHAIVKGNGAKLTETQMVWHETLKHAGGVEVYFWQPKDLATVITQRLSRRIAHDSSPPPNERLA